MTEAAARNAADASGPQPETLPRRFGRYMLVRRLAAGGMAVLYLAIHRSIAGIERLLVIKRILPEYGRDRGYIEMLLKEARIAMTFAHANIVTVFDVGQADGEYYIAMEHIHGEDLRAVVRAMKPKGVSDFPLEHALAVGIGVAAGLSYAHEKRDLQGNPLRVVHRDISPQNIVVTFTGEVKVVDFGIAKASLAHHAMPEPGSATRTARPSMVDSGRRNTETSLNSLDEGTGPGKVKGKVPYMSPEQARGEELDHRSDIFSLGILLYELATGRRLFRAPSDADAIKMITDGVYPRPSEVNLRVSPSLEAVIMKALAPDREQRYQSARELHADLESVARADHIPVSTVALGEWMRMLFAERLAEQDAMLAEGKALFDQLPDEPESHDVSQTVTVVPRGEGKRPLGVVMGGIALVLAVGGGLWWRSTQQTAAQSQAGHVVLAVRSTPDGAHIWLNDAPTSQRTPYEFASLAPGRYRVRVTADGYDPWNGDVNLSAVGARDTVHATLTRAHAASLVVLEVSTTPPGARVIVDGREAQGVTPVTVSELQPGVEHTVLVRSPDHTDESFTFVGAAGRVESRALTLRERPLGPGEAWLNVTTDPPTATLRANGRDFTGGGPYRVRVPSGRALEVMVTAPGYDTVSRMVTVPEGQTLARAIRLPRAHADTTANTHAPPPPPPPPPVDTTPGQVRVGANPVWCEAFVDGRSYGQTPTQAITLSPGRHTFRCVSPERGTRTQTVNIAPGARQAVRFDFTQP